MSLNVILVDPMGHFSRVVNGLCTVAINGCVDKVLDAVFDSFVN
jgi:hypothetical protein